MTDDQLEKLFWWMCKNWKTAGLLAFKNYAKELQAAQATHQDHCDFVNGRNECVCNCDATPADQTVPEDFALVPIRMNANMINAWSGGKTVSSDEIAYRTTFQNAWKRVLEAAPQAPQKDVWISVADRLPEIIEWSPGSVAGISEPVYVYFGEDEDQAVWRYRRGGRGDLTSCYWDLDGITPTHWRPVHASPNLGSNYLEG
jgi:hypothetical protein